MSQDIWSAINPLTTSGVMLAGLLDDFKDALMTGCAGTSRPSNLQAGGLWVDTTNQIAPNYYWAFKFYNGTTDVEIFRISILNGFGGTLIADATFVVQEIAADAIGPILQLVKNRIANNGQVLTGDAVAEVRFTGRTDTSTDPTVAYLKFTSTDNMTGSNYGGTLSMYSTPDATASIVEHLRFINGMVETVSAHKLNSLQPVSQNVATAATITALNSDKHIVEMTGATATDIQGVDADGDSWHLIIHNRSTATVTLKHENAGASAANRLKLPGALDHSIEANSTATLIYSSSESRWKLKAAVRKRVTRTIEKLNGAYQQWTAPAGVTRARIVGYPIPEDNIGNQIFKDAFGNAYAFGYQAVGVGSLGVGDNTPRSSPVAVVGGFFYKKVSIIQYSGLGLTTTGVAYAWGQNTIGEAGVGDVNPRSSPVAVLGGFKFANIFTGWDRQHTYALDEKGAAYAWGDNSFYQLGNGDQNPRSSPVAVLGGFKFSRIAAMSQGNIICIDRSGNAYAWGSNNKGQLGVGDVVTRSSPVAVLGSLKFKKIVIGQSSVVQDSAIGLTTSGALYAWGVNNKGQLGVGDVTARSSPVAVLGGLTFVDVAISTGGGTGQASVYAITSNGTMYAWGDNTAGQLGLGDVTARSSPVAVLGGFLFNKISIPQDNTGGGYVFGLTKDGVAYGWGKNSIGHLGVGDLVARSSPVAVLGSLIFDYIFIGGNNSNKGITRDGTVYAWGYNGNGELGVGDTTHRSSPVAVLGAFGINQVAPLVDIEISVTPATTYDVVLAQGESSFGNTPIGFGINNITIEYEV